MRQREDVGEVVFVLCVVAVEAVQPAAQTRRVGHDDPRIHFTNRPLLRRRVAVLDDGSDVSLRVADDPPVAGRILGLHGQQRKVGRMMADHFLEHGQRDQRMITEQNEHRRAIGYGRHDLHDSVAGSAAWRLNHPVDVTLTANGPDLVCAVADHHVERGRLQRRGRVQQMRQQRTTAQLVQDLGQI